MALQWDFYLNLIFSIGGIVFFILSLTIIQKINKLFPGGRIIKKWFVIRILIIGFLAGYVLNIICLYLELQDLVLVMTAIVYIFGGFFVYLVINLSYRTYKVIVEESTTKTEQKTV